MNSARVSRVQTMSSEVRAAEPLKPATRPAAAADHGLQMRANVMLCCQVMAVCAARCKERRAGMVASFTLLLALGYCPYAPRPRNLGMCDCLPRPRLL